MYVTRTNYSEVDKGDCQKGCHQKAAYGQRHAAIKSEPSLGPGIFRTNTRIFGKNTGVFRTNPVVFRLNRVPGPY